MIKTAVLELRNQVEFKDTDVSNFTDKIRFAGADILPQKTHIIMTQESIIELLPAGVDLSDCSNAECEVEIGRKIGADYIVSGEIFKFEDDLRINLKVHNSFSGAFLGGKTASGTTKKLLEESLISNCKEMFNLILAHARKSQPWKGEVNQGNQGNQGEIGEKVDTAWEPDQVQREVALLPAMTVT
jgi:hypothetical protein